MRRPMHPILRAAHWLAGNGATPHLKLHRQLHAPVAPHGQQSLAGRVAGRGHDGAAGALEQRRQRLFVVVVGDLQVGIQKV
jgi:hypothetical protein